MTPEGKVKIWFMNQVEKRYGSLAVWSYAPPGGYFGQNGTADRLLLIESGNEAPGIFVAVEVKADGNKPTPLQMKKLRDVHAAGGVAASLIGKDHAKISAIFAEIDKRREAARIGWAMVNERIESGV